ncbi:hypothetical protein HY450_02475 [Candidatus Pacearchaeota archaeon]|nr:hypothetical protein [Candidatus Pacearchaeota archaeon]
MKKIVMLILVFSIIFSIINILFLGLVPVKDFQYITGKGVVGILALIIEGDTLNITILHPTNTTYNFSIGATYAINLNVSSNYNTSNWWYTLRDERHNLVVNNSILFTPNTTIYAVRWDNRLLVYANDSSGVSDNKNVTFFINVPNSAPVLGSVDNEIYVCEGSALSYFFNATDVDEDNLTFDIIPKNPFFVNTNPINQTINSQNTTAKNEIFSGVIGKNDVRNYSENLSVSDSSLADSKSINITAIEINNAPGVENIGVKTIYTQGDNQTLFEEWDVSDVENGNQSSGNFTFNTTFSSGSWIFNISQSGVINFTANSTYVGVYDIAVCVVDLGIKNIHQNISVCGQSGTNRSSCDSFELTITGDNRAPTITSYSPVNLVFDASSTESLLFNVSERDPDGSTPDTYWYVDEVRKEIDSGATYDTFSYSFGCGVSGVHRIRVDTTDGSLNDSVQWNATISKVSCPVQSAGAGGGGGGGGGGGASSSACGVKWACHAWQLCQNTERSFEIGVISGDHYREVSEECSLNDWDDDVCGFQIRNCVDVNECNREFNKPGEIQACYFTIAPSCFDGIENCHDGECEFLVDCGGPCLACSTCSDGVQNQGEENVDCGGPCPNRCPVEKPSRARLIHYLIVVTLLLVILLIVKLYRVIMLKKTRTKKVKK